MSQQADVSYYTIDKALRDGLIRAERVSGTRTMRYRLYPPHAGEGVPQS